ncbi:Foldase protein PrsA [Candidatus Tiddalikarchaeum anstoanum]|nr:Foldase protein PrsA [Candidatus Tiddalikarchaeum anstoanum]
MTIMKASHILVKDEATAKAIIDYLKKHPTEPNAFELLAQKYSICPSKAKGGDLGVFNDGDMVPEFEAAVLKLKNGEITQAPVKTQFGYHVIKRTA